MVLPLLTWSCHIAQRVRFLLCSIDAPDSEPLPLQDVDHIIRQAAEALQYAHDQQIIHRDVKPSNFLIRGRSGGARIPNLLLADFGLAKLTNLSATMSQSIRGTPTYMAPEQWSGSPVPATDQYALAVMAYELLTGRPPFEGTQQQMMFHHLMTQPQPPSRYNPRFSPDMDAVLLRALAKKPEDRFPSISAFADAFSQALKGQQQPAADPRPIAQKPLAQPPGPVSGPGRSTTYPSASPLPELAPTPSRPTPVITPPQGARRSCRVNASLLITLASVLLLLTGSIGAFFVVRNNQIATDNANATSTASSQTATANNATATPIAQATATETAVANANPYGGTLTFSDTLADNTNGWCMYSAQCNFSGSVLHLIDSGAGGPSYVTGVPVNAHLDFSNFAYQVQMKVLKGFGGGILFRSDSNISNYYYFLIGTDGSYNLVLRNESASPPSQTIKSGSSSAINTGVNQTNFVAVVAEGSTLKLYVNQQFITSVDDGTYTHGTIGLFAYDSGHPNNEANPPVEVVFSNVKVWTL